MSEEVQRAAALVFADKAREIAEFCLARGGERTFQGWPVPTLFAYAFFHSVDRTVFVARDHGAIAAVVFAWGVDETELRRCVAEKRPLFAWRRGKDDGDSVFLAEMVGARRYIPALYRQVSARFRGFARKTVFTFRRGQLARLEPAVIQRMIVIA